MPPLSAASRPKRRKLKKRLIPPSAMPIVKKMAGLLRPRRYNNTEFAFLFLLIRVILMIPNLHEGIK